MSWGAARLDAPSFWAALPLEPTDAPALPPPSLGSPGGCGFGCVLGAFVCIWRALGVLVPAAWGEGQPPIVLTAAGAVRTLDLACVHFTWACFGEECKTWLACILPGHALERSAKMKDSACMSHQVATPGAPCCGAAALSSRKPCCACHPGRPVAQVVHSTCSRKTCSLPALAAPSPPYVRLASADAHAQALVWAARRSCRAPPTRCWWWAASARTPRTPAACCCMPTSASPTGVVHKRTGGAGVSL